MGFESFVGNAAVVARLRTKLRENRFPHALIFAGAEGVGKHTLARAIAKALNCAAPGLAGDQFCDSCDQCRKIEAGSHPDVMRITVEEDATRIKIAQIRRLLATLEMRPLEGRNKVFLIDPANLMNDESSNALLKGLEEPPDNSYFILLTPTLHDLLITVRSRCQAYPFAPLRLEEIRARGTTDELTVRWSQGSIGRALKLDVEALRQQREPVLRFLEAAVNATDETLRDMLGASAELSRTRQDFAEHLAIVAVLLEDILYIAEGRASQIVNIDVRQRLEQLAGIAPTERWLRVADFLRVLESGVRGNLNRQLMTDSLALIAAGFAE